MNRQYRRMLAKSGGGERLAQEMYKIGADDANRQTTTSSILILFVRRIPLALAMGRKPHFLQSDIIQSYKQTTVFRWPSIQNDV